MSRRTAPLVAAPSASPAPARLPLDRRLIKGFLSLYMRPYHQLELVGAEHIPPRGPILVVLNHASLLDVPALMVLDPFPDTATVVKVEMFRMPVVGWFLRRWGAIPVERDGRDSSGIRRMLGVLRAGGALAVAAEGTRTRSGHLEAINPVFARIAASADVPILPVGIGGSYAALPAGAFVPRPVKILVRVGPVFRLERGTDADAAARRIRSEIARLLPPEMQPLD
ncbi:MAG: 1-acyl-sn-glycerol-3-phosphate acyltransferase [Chloroflexi bacterium]|nr:1-acyl-sn-glycerol-3-phosphate acyltransferase [Chloroflexota bacterium]MBV9600547.1 1-acyl-sn-glycerol-3-phosphate acyltransferase [Chloroflexota bacterium]